MADYEQMNGIALAYIGDAIYEVYVRKHLLDKGMTKPNKLHKRATHYVSAKAQAALISQMEEQNLLTDEEKEYFRRGRNAPKAILRPRTPRLSLIEFRPDLKHYSDIFI